MTARRARGISDSPSRPLRAAMASGCGLGAGDSPGGASLLVTRDFGAVEVGSRRGRRRCPAGRRCCGSCTAASRSRRATAAGSCSRSTEWPVDARDGRPVDWFYYVNGIEAGQGAAATKLAEGDRIWWDHHDWGAAHAHPRRRRVVPGAVPARSRRPAAPAAHRVRRGRHAGLRRGVAASGRGRRQAGDRGAGSNGRTCNIVRVLVGPWSSVRRDNATAQLDRGPAASGVYARLRRRRRPPGRPGRPRPAGADARRRGRPGRGDEHRRAGRRRGS